MFKSINETIDKAPFAGKYSTRLLVSDYISSDESNEKSRFAKTASFLGVMVVAHAYQAYLGYNAAESHVESYQNTDNPADVMLTALDSSYAFINSAVTLRQINLMKRVAQIRSKKLDSFNSEAPKDVSDKKERTSRSLAKKGIVAAGVITLAGQAVFLGSYFDAKTKEYTNECYDSASEFYDTYAEEHPDIDIVAKEIYTDEFCAV